MKATRAGSAQRGRPSHSAARLDVRPVTRIVSAHAAVALRTTWETVRLYVDDQAYGPISSLKTIPAIHITSIRLYRAWEATTKYGQGNMGGVIAVSTKQ